MQAPTISVEITKDTQVLSLEHIHFNPHQMWAIDPAHVAELAEDIRRNGILQRPLARPHPTQAGHVQLAFGHHRRAAAAAAGLAEMAVDVREISDLEMADYAITENFKRRTPTALDKARALQRLMAEPFKLTQAEAGVRFGLSQPAVANLVRMLKLPAPIQTRIDSGELPERMARGLVTLATALPEAAVQVAAKVAAAEGTDKELVYADAVDSALESFGQRLPHNVPFKLDKPLRVDPRTAAAAAALSLTAGGEFPACKGCEHFMERNHQRFCSRPPCYAAKVETANWAALATPAKQLGITVAGPDERVSLVCAGGDDEELRRLAVAALKAKDASLRLVPAGDKGGYPDWRKQQWRKEHLAGAEFAALAVTNLAALKKAYPAPANKSAKSEAERAKQLAEADAEREKRYAQQERERKREQAEIERLEGLFLPLLAKILPDQPALLRLMWDANDRWYMGKVNDWSTIKGLPAQKLAAAQNLIHIYEDSIEAVTILEDMDIPNSRMTSAGTAATLRALGQELKLKLPADFEPPAPKIAEDEDAPVKSKAKKTPAKKGGKK